MEPTGLRLQPDRPAAIGGKPGGEPEVLRHRRNRNEASRGGVQQEVRGISGTMAGRSLDRHPRTARRRLGHVHALEISRLHRQHPGGVRLRGQAHRQQRSPEREGEQAMTAAEVCTPIEHLHGTGGDQRQQDQRQQPVQREVGGSERSGESEPAEGNPSEPGDDAETREVEDQPGRARAQRDAGGMAQGYQEQHRGHPKQGRRRIADERFVPPTAELEPPLHQGRREQDQGADGKGQAGGGGELAGPHGPTWDRPREVEAEAAFREIAGDDRGSQDQRQAEAEAEGNDERHGRPQVRAAALREAGNPGRRERHQTEQERRGDEQPPLDDLALQDGQKGSHDGSSASPVRAMKISSRVRAETSGPSGSPALKRSSS